jgi:hypothetical protein
MMPLSCECAGVDTAFLRVFWFVISLFAAMAAALLLLARSMPSSTPWAAFRSVKSGQIYKKKAPATAPRVTPHTALTPFSFCVRAFVCSLPGESRVDIETGGQGSAANNYNWMMEALNHGTSRLGPGRMGVYSSRYMWSQVMPGYNGPTNYPLWCQLLTRADTRTQTQAI